MSAPIEFTRLASFDTSPCAGRIERHGYSRQCRQTPLWHTEVGAVQFAGGGAMTWVNALLALRDCQVIRAAASDPAYRELADRGLAVAVIASPQLNKRDYRLTSAGEAVALRLKPLQ